MVRIRIPENRPRVNFDRIESDYRKGWDPRFDDFWKEHYNRRLPLDAFQEGNHVTLEVGSGSGDFICELAKAHPKRRFVALERSQTRGARLVQRQQKRRLDNLTPYRGNAIPVLIHGIPTESVDLMYHLYPCPWPKTAQRKHRWYLHPAMPHMVRILKPGGKMIWASDQQFFIEEAHYVCTRKYGLKALAHGPLEPNPWNELTHFPNGRTVFERHFFEQAQPTYELVVEKI